ncbi:hypothetical protein M758_UG178300 [Ceratodon purpureus]|nr:hypothetical protein M758_UG178300 [Ceratodon purpureus]
MAELFMDVLRELDDVNAVYFSVLIDSEALLSPVEIPETFTTKTGWPGETECAIETSISDRIGSPLSFNYVGRKWVDVGSGWQTFLREHNVTVRKLVWFEMLDDRCLIASIYPREKGQTFTKTMQASHVRPFSSTRLDIPMKFWRSVGEAKFDGVFYGLRGPLTKTVVKSTVTHTPAQTTMSEIKELLFSTIHDTTLAPDVAGDTAEEGSPAGDVEVESRAWGCSLVDGDGEPLVRLDDGNLVQMWNFEELDAQLRAVDVCLQQLELTATPTPHFSIPTPASAQVPRDSKYDAGEIIEPSQTGVVVVKKPATALHERRHSL